MIKQEGSVFLTPFIVPEKLNRGVMYVILRVDTGEFVGIKRWAHETLWAYKKRASEKLPKKLKEGHWVSSVKLSRGKYGWAAKFLRSPIDDDKYPLDVLVLDTGTMMPKYYYNHEQAIVAMALIDEKFSVGGYDKAMIVEYLTSKEFIDAFNEVRKNELD